MFFNCFLYFQYIRIFSNSGFVHIIPYFWLDFSFIFVFVFLYRFYCFLSSKILPFPFVSDIIITVLQLCAGKIIILKKKGKSKWERNCISEAT